jgi:iron complex outermembrane receptor protein
MNHSITRVVSLFSVLTFTSVGLAQELDGMDSLDLSELLNLEITTASMSAESILDAPAPMYIVTREDIKNRGYTDFTQIMDDMPGFDISNVGGNTEYFAYQRGFRSVFNNRTLFLINGRTFNTLWFQDAQIGHQIPVEAIERIEVLYGPAGVIYGPNAFLGVINVITTTAADLDVGEYDVRSAFTMGSWATRRTDLHARTRISENLALTLTARFGRSDGADISDRDNKWMSTDFLNSETIYGPILEMSSNGYDFGISSNPDDDRMFMASLELGDFTIDGYMYQIAGSNGPQYAGDHSQASNFWPAKGVGGAITHNYDVDDSLHIFSELSYRTSGRYGLWVDAYPSWNEGQSEYSYLSMIDFRTDNNALEWRQNVFWDMTDDMKLSAGYRYVRKQLTKAYDIGDGYFAGYNSNGPDDNSAIFDTFPCDIDSDGDGEPDGTGFTNYETGECGPYDAGSPSSYRMPMDNMVLTEDIGGFVEGSYRWGDLKLNVGLRYDINTNPQVSPEDEDDPTSHRGYKAISPRVGLIYKFSDLGFIENGAVKFLYGTAIQEPAPTQLWGGWSGRAAAPALQEESGRNYELVTLLQTGPVLSDISMFFAEYQKVHVAPADNAGRRRIWGAEYKGRLELENPIPSSGKITSYVNLSYTKSESYRYYDFETGEWTVVGDNNTMDTGDIAPVKLHLGMNIPMTEYFNLNVRGRYIAAKIPFLSNPLRDPSRPDGGEPDYFHEHFVGDVSMNIHYGIATLNLAVYNITNADYNHPGDGEANAGDGWVVNPDGSMDTTVRATGYRNSLVPQALRNFMFSLKLDI